jgi:hypothetical protein
MGQLAFESIRKQRKKVTRAMVMIDMIMEFKSILVL